MSANKMDPSKYFELLRKPSERNIGSKRKLTNMIMDDIEMDNFSPIPKSRVKTRVESIFESQSQPDYFEEHTYSDKKKINNIQSGITKRSKISIDLLFDDENSQLKSKKAVPVFNKKIHLHSDDDISIEESDEIFKKGFVKEKNSKYNIDDFLTEENPPEINARPNFEKLSSKKSSENEYVIQEVSQNFELNKNLKKKFNNNIKNLDELIGDSSPLTKKKIVTTTSSKYVDEIQDDYLDSYKLKTHKAKCKKLADIDDILKNDIEFQLPIKDKNKVDYLSVSNNFLCSEETEAHSSNKASIADPNLSSQEKYSQHQFDIRDDLNFNSQVRQNLQIDKKSNWMQDINLKLNESSMLICGNESNIFANAPGFLSQMENKKKKIKFIKNGYADRLQKLLLRQKSSINFIKHHLNKKSAADKLTQKSENLSNVVKLMPFFRQNYLTTKFTLIHAFNVTNFEKNEFDISLDNVCYILLSNDIVDYSSYFETDVIQSKYLINIYPPWRKFLMKNSNKLIYFGTNLIEIFPVDHQSFFYEKFNASMEDHVVITLNALQCPSCVDSADCTLNLFDSNNYQILLKKKLPKITNFVQSQKNIFFTQSASEFFTQNITNNTQFLRTNSILDALENIGYYGFANFKATVQRIGLVKNNSISLYHTQRTQTQYDDNHYKRQIIVSDKVGLFALIVFPLNVDSCFINESNEYEFNSIKFVEKQTFSNKENSDLNDQITFLCQKMKKKRENKTKQSLTSIQKFIYIFEFISANRSILTELGISKEFIQRESFLSLRDLKSSNFESNWFNLFDIILIKMYLDAVKNEYLIFFVEKSEFLSNNVFKIKKFTMQSTFHIKDKSILSKLQENYIIFQSNFECQSSVICMKNVGLDKSNIENSVLFGSFSSVEAADPSQFNSILLKHNHPYGKDRNFTKKFFDNKLSLWENDSSLKFYDFGLVKGNIISVYEENCCFDFYCQSCQNNQINSEFLHQSQLDFDRSIKSWICNVCGNVSETPLIKIQIQVILNCVGISRKLNLKLHELTIKKFLNFDCLMKQFTQDNENGFNISTLIDKHVGPTSCFITNINENEIFAEEIILDIL